MIYTYTCVYIEYIVSCIRIYMYTGKKNIIHIKEYTQIRMQIDIKVDIHIIYKHIAAPTIKIIQAPFLSLLSSCH